MSYSISTSAFSSFFIICTVTISTLFDFFEWGRLEKNKETMNAYRLHFAQTECFDEFSFMSVSPLADTIFVD